MNNLILAVLFSMALISCKESPKQEVVPDNSAVDVSKLAYPVRYINWEKGDFNNLVVVSNFYKLWDENRPDEMATYFADTLRLRLPEEESEFIIPGSEIKKRLTENRNMYQNTSNALVSAVSLKDKTSGDEWVMVTTYSKWTEKSGKRDSLLYHDDWRVKDGKINLLMSFSKSPVSKFNKK